MQVVVVVDGPIIAAIFKIESTVGRLAVGGNDKPRFFSFRVGNHGKRQGQWQRNVGNGHVDWAGHNLVVGDDLGLGELELVVRVVFQVAGGVAARLDMDAVVVHALHALSVQVAALFLGPNLGDDAFLRLEVVEHLLRLKSRFALLEDGPPLQFAQRIDGTVGAAGAGFEVEFEAGRRQYDVVVFCLGVAEIVDFLLVHVAVRRVGSRANHLSFDGRIGRP